MAGSSFDGSLRENHLEAIQQATMGVTFDAWIDGEPAVAEDSRRFETVDPAVREPITTVPRCGSTAVDDAVEASQGAASDWKGLSAPDRSDLILDWVDRLEAHASELALLECLDTGKPLTNARLEVDDALEYLSYYAHVVLGDEGSQIPIADDAHAYVTKEPYGVAGLIVPWNYPLLLTAWKVGPALAAGNTVVLKPAENTPLSATRIAQLSADILPSGVLNVVHGYGDEVGAPITSHPDVDKLSFTGADTTGQRVMTAAAEQITPVTLELGGKSPLVVFPDADLERAASIAATGVFYNTGQSCDALSRTLVHESVHDEFMDLFAAEAADRTIGDPLLDRTAMGPLASEAQYEKYKRYVELGQEEGATLVRGGDDADVPDEGWFVEPTIFDDVDNNMRIAQEEIFGPVASVITFEDYEEAIEIANDIDFGLAAGVTTSDLSLAHHAAEAIEAGTVWVNQYARLVPGTPFGGFKRSGIGRECAKETLEQYQQSKTINVKLDDPEL